MSFSKIEMQDELCGFMQEFALSIERLYGGNVGQILENKVLIKKSNLWIAVNDMYDFGVLGMPVLGLGDEPQIDGIYADAEVFLNCIAKNAMEQFFYEDDVSFPKLSIKSARIAVARVVLEDGERYTDYGAGDYGWGNGDWGYLTLGELALLADMDERSVRNAANPKVNDPLKTESVGKRSLVEPHEARRWLLNRKGFIQTKQIGKGNNRILSKSIELPSDVVEALNIKAEKSGLSTAEFIKNLL